jgi:hypothetical protein
MKGRAQLLQLCERVTPALAICGFTELENLAKLMLRCIGSRETRACRDRGLMDKKVGHLSTTEGAHVSTGGADELVSVVHGAPK